MAVGIAAPFGEAAFRALEVLIAEAKAGDPLAPVTVVAPSNYAGLSLRRRMGESGGVVNVRFLVLARVAELLGAPGLPRQTPVTAWQRASAVAAALTNHDGIFAPVAGHAATERALGRIFLELDSLPSEGLAVLAGQSQRSADLVAIHSNYRAALASTYDAEDLARAATEGIERRTHALRDLGHIILFLPRPLPPASTAFVRALLQRGLASVVFGVANDPVADRETGDLAASIGLPMGPASGDAPVTATGILRAADLEEEVRSAIRDLLARTEAGTPLSRMAIVFPAPETYSSLVEELLAAAEIPFNGPPSRRLTDSAVARSLLGLLSLEERGFRREEIVDWLATAPVLLNESTSDTVAATTWDELARDAGVVRGLDQWDHRLEAQQNRRDTSDEERERIEVVRTFTRELSARLVTPTGSVVAAFARWADALVVRYLGDIERFALRTNAREFAAYERVRALLAEMTSDTHTLCDGLPAFIRLIEHAFNEPGGRLGPFGQGVFIGPLASARGMQFDHIFILGLVDGALPASDREDPLLTDEEREAAGLVVHRSRRERMRADYLAALASAPSRTLCFPRSSLRSGTTTLPSPWLVETAEVLAGHPLTSDEFMSLSASDWLQSSASFRQSLVRENALPMSLQEWEVASLARVPSIRQHFLASDARFQYALQAATEHLPRFARRQGVDTATLSSWAGNIGADAHVMEATPFSPTSFEVLAACPYRYLLANVLRVKETARPSEIIRIGGADRGTLMHDVLEEFFVEVDHSGSYPGPTEPWSPHHQRRLMEIAEKHCHRAYDRGIVGSELLWRIDRARIRRDLLLFLDVDSRVRAERRTTFLRSELAFGMDAERLGLEPGTETPPVRIDLAGTEVLFRGRIDRVDRAEDGTLIVYDYKSGKSEDYKPLMTGKQQMGSGNYLQLPIYALAAASLQDDDEAPIEAYYWFTSEAEKFELAGGRVGPGHMAALKTTLGVLSNLVSEGLFPAVSGAESWNFNGKTEGFANCNKFCQYGRICEGGDRAAKWEQRKGAFGLDGFVALADLQSADGESNS